MAIKQWAKPQGFENFVEFFKQCLWRQWDRAWATKAAAGHQGRLTNDNKDLSPVILAANFHP
jgi:hypothetical protein